MVLAGLAACGGEEASPLPRRAVTVDVSTETAVAEVDPRFLSFAVDTAQALGGPFWSNSGAKGAVGDLVRPPMDFSDPALQARIEPLTPSFIRIGGSAADTVYYDLGTSPVTEPPEPFELVLTAPLWARLMDLVGALDLELLWTLNAGPGTRDDAKAWQDAQSRALLQHAADRGDRVAVWELGNEINGFPFVLGLSEKVEPQQYAADVALARAMVDELQPNSLLAGPSSAYWPLGGEINPILPEFMPLAGKDLDVVTWHYYPQQSERCPLRELPATAEMPLDPLLLDNADKWSAEVEGYRDAHAPDVPVWLGETGGAQCGGQSGVSDRFVGGFWWLDQLGLLARRGTPIVIRQSLTDASYGLLDGEDLSARPDYFNAVLHKRLMGTRVLDVVASDPSQAKLRAYAHCTAPTAQGYTEGAVTLLVLNLSQTHVAELTDLGFPRDGALWWHLDADGLESRRMRLNGRELAMQGDALPDLSGDPLPDGPLSLAPPSYAFVVLPAANAAACL